MHRRGPTPTQASRQVVAGVAASALLSIGGALALDAAAHTSPNMRAELSTPNHAIIHGCPVEDACRIDYRNGRWHIVLRRSYR